jgi:hypothetical protein
MIGWNPFHFIRFVFLMEFCVSFWVLFGDLFRVMELGQWKVKVKPTANAGVFRELLFYVVGRWRTQLIGRMLPLR